MNWTPFQRLAVAAFVCVELLLFVGAAVRASGSGLGCPDWPFCYGCWVPPTSAEAIDFSKLDLEKFRKKAAQHGRDPATITEETLRAEFDPVATWIEYLNRLTSLPVGLSVLAMWLASIGEWRRGRARVLVAATASLGLVLVNAWLGARVVLSGLQPGIITLHMALAILLLCVLIYTAWRAHAHPWRLPDLSQSRSSKAWWWALVLFALVVIEGVLGSQVREMTDQLAKVHFGEKRSQWVGELEQTTVYLIHRSFSWLILAAAIAFGLAAKRRLGRLGALEISILALVGAQMVLGVVLGHIGILPLAQVLHVGLSSLLVSGLFLWILAGKGGVTSRAT